MLLSPPNIFNKKVQCSAEAMGYTRLGDGSLALRRIAPLVLFLSSTPDLPSSHVLRVLHVAGGIERISIFYRWTRTLSLKSAHCTNIPFILYSGANPWSTQLSHTYISTNAPYIQLTCIYSRVESKSIHSEIRVQTLRPLNHKSKQR